MYRPWKKDISLYIILLQINKHHKYNYITFVRITSNQKRECYKSSHILEETLIIKQQFRADNFRRFKHNWLNITKHHVHTILCFNIVTLDMILIFNFIPIIIWTMNIFLIMEIAENTEKIIRYCVIFFSSSHFKFKGILKTASSLKVHTHCPKPQDFRLYFSNPLPWQLIFFLGILPWVLKDLRSM